MAYENITVRMNRSNLSIQWGFHLRQGAGNDIVISSVEKDSMAEKAGLAANDIICDISGRSGHSLAEANRTIAGAFEISMNLKRWVTSLPQLPWTLNEKDSKIVVDSIGPGGLKPLHTQDSDGFVNSFWSDTQTAPGQRREYRQSDYKRNFQETRTRTSTSPAVAFQPSAISPPAPTFQQAPPPPSAAPFQAPPPTSAPFSSQVSPPAGGALNPKSTSMSTYSHSNWDTQEGNVKKHFESSKSYEKSESSSTTQYERPFGAPGAFTSSGGAGFGSGFGTDIGRGGDFGSGGAGFGGFTSGGNPGNPVSAGFRDDTFRHNGVNEQLSTHIPPPSGPRAQSMQHSPAAFSPRQKQDKRPNSTSPYTGPRQYYQHNPRTVRELSPTATVQHLQYNSPFPLYSKESAAEAYRQQTGGLFGTDPNINRPNDPPAYLSSETRRLIAENEEGFPRSCSPATQSASFKRISTACGTPVK
uniref:PDZ domain-containing protein n=1 Tax=Steinernema glaseri TaxID=37863 RepID=A0A1I7YL21_9BILA